jgi:PAS domain-containing protein
MSISSNSQLCNQLQYALFAADMAILIEDEHRKIQFVNQAYCDVLELPMKPEELIGFDFATTSIFVRHQFQSIDDFASRASQFEKEAIIQRDDKLVTKSGVVILRYKFQ